MRTDFGRKREDEMQLKTKTKRFSALLLTVGTLFAAGCGGAPGEGTLSRPPKASSGVERAEETPSHCELTPVNRLYDNFSDSYQAFSVSMLRALYQAAQTGAVDAPDGVVLSPASLYIALGMTAEGMEGDTLGQTMALLHAGDADALREGCRDLLSLLSGNPKNSFRWADALWIKDSFQDHILPGFLQRNRDFYDAQIKFHAFDDTLIPSVNSWVEEQTDGLIEELLQPPLDDDLFLLLLNTLLFDARWESPFDGRESAEGTFHGVSGDVTLPFMRQTYRGMGYQDADVTAALLDYDDGRTAMLVAVPREGTGGLDALMASMDKDTVPGWLKGMTEQQVGMVLPRFSMEYRVELKEVLSGMGMTDAFDPDKADFSGLTEREPVFIGQVIHQTALEVGEKGTRAAAATAVEILCGSAMNVLSVGADRPFFCAVVDKPTGALLFAAAVTDPKPLA